MKMMVQIAGNSPCAIMMSFFHPHHIEAHVIKAQCKTPENTYCVKISTFTVCKSQVFIFLQLSLKGHNTQHSGQMGENISD